MFGMLNKNSITRIARLLPTALVDVYGKQDFYSPEEVRNIFKDKLTDEHNIEYAFAMFCSKSDFDALKLLSTYEELRAEISKECFGNWPRFNFNSLLDFSLRSTTGSDIGILGGDGGCGGGGE